MDISSELKNASLESWAEADKPSGADNAKRIGINETNNTLQVLMNDGSSLEIGPSTIADADAANSVTDQAYTDAQISANNLSNTNYVVGPSTGTHVAINGGVAAGTVAYTATYPTRPTLINVESVDLTADLQVSGAGPRRIVIRQDGIEVFTIIGTTANPTAPITTFLMYGVTGVHTYDILVYSGDAYTSATASNLYLKFVQL